MNTFILYLAAVTLCGMSTILIRNATVCAATEEGNIEMRSRLLFVARVFIAVAALAAGFGALTQYSTLHHQ